MWDSVRELDFELRKLFKCAGFNKGPITCSFFNPGVEFSPVNRAEIAALALLNQRRDYMAKFSTQG